MSHSAKKGFSCARLPAGDARDGRGERFQPRSRNPNVASRSRTACPELPRPMTPTVRAEAAAPRAESSAPRLVLHVVEEVAVQGQHRQGHVLHHAVNDARFDHAHELHVRRNGRKVDVVDAGARREQHLEVGHRRDEAAGACQDDQVLDLVEVAGIGPYRNSMSGACSAKNRAQAAARGASDR